jgi:Reverse transcriptase (RNA-dependent DNA polymerase)/gag-polypeptide of LTR copia-type/Integrase core domain/GAG-pre-integrase domain
MPIDDDAKSASAKQASSTPSGSGDRATITLWPNIKAPSIPHDRILKIDASGSNNWLAWDQWIRVCVAFPINLWRVVHLESAALGEIDRATHAMYDELLMSIILMSVDSDLVHHIENVDSSIKMLEIISTLCARRSLISQAALYAELHSQAIGEQTISVFFNKITMLIKKLANTGYTIDDHARKLLVVAQLMRDDKYNHLLARFNEERNASLSLEEIMVQITAEEDRIHHKNASSSSSPTTSALAAATRGKNPSNSNRKCTHCTKYNQSNPTKTQRTTAHDASTCFHVHGYPEWHHAYKPPPSSGDSVQAGTKTNTALASSLSSGLNFTFPPVISGAFVAIRVPSQLALTVSSPRDALTTFIDSGASTHFVNNLNLLTNAVRLPVVETVQFGQGFQRATHRGDFDCLVARDDGSTLAASFKNALFVPDMSFILLSLGAILNNGHKLTSEGTTLVISNASKELLFKTKKSANNMYELIVKPCIEKAGMLSSSCPPASAYAFTSIVNAGASLLQTWHNRLGHLNFTDIIKLRSHSNGIDKLPDISSQPLCVDCARGKQHRLPFSNRRNNNVKRVLDCISTDIAGPFPPSISGNRYLLLFLDHYSRLAWIYFLRHKSDAFAAFVDYKAKVELKHNTKIKQIRSDRGGEFMSKEWDALLQSSGIMHWTGPAHSPQSNGLAERYMRTVVEGGRTVLLASGLPHGFWAEAMSYSCFTRNRSPHSAINFHTPYSKWEKKIPNLAGLRIFGCRATVHVPDANRKKLDAKSDVGVFVGYDQEPECYRIWVPAKYKIVISRDVLFDESSFSSAANFLTSSFVDSSDINILPLPPSLIRIDEGDLDANQASNAASSPQAIEHNDSVIIANFLAAPDAAINDQVDSSKSSALADSLPASAQPESPADQMIDSDQAPSSPPDLASPITSRNSRRPGLRSNPVPNVDNFHERTLNYAAPARYDAREVVHPLLARFRASIAVSFESVVDQDANAEQKVNYAAPARHDANDDAQPLLARFRASIAASHDRSSHASSLESNAPPIAFAALSATHPEWNDQFKKWIEAVVDAETASELPIDLSSVDSTASGLLNNVALASAVIAAAAQDLSKEPRSLRDALTRSDAELWLAAALEEWNALIAFNVFDLCNLPPGEHAIGSKLVFKLKYDADGNIERYKARIVAQGFSQIPGRDFDETFAPTVKLSTLRALFALAAIKNMEIHQMDVNNAYLNGTLARPVYMRLPAGFASPDMKMVMKLKKGLYGLRQSGRIWYCLMRKELIKLGFSPLNADPCVFRRKQNGVLTYLALFVDDCLIFSDNLDGLKAFKLELASKFKMKDLGEAKLFLGLQLERDRAKKILRIHQRLYTESMVERLQLHESKPVQTPMEKLKVDLSSVEEENIDDINKSLPAFDPPDHNVHITSLDELNVSYAAKIGQLMYLMLGTRPDLAFPVCYLSQFTLNPTPEHEAALKRLLRYVNATKHWCLVFDGTLSDDFKVYCDSDWGGNLKSMSTTGVCCIFAGCAIVWRSNKQKTVALSSSQAEYQASTEGAKEVMWLRSLFPDLDWPISGPSILFGDNQGAIALAKNPEFHSRTKHIRIQYHFIRQCVDEGDVKVVYIPTADMIADILTKPLLRVHHQRCCEAMGLRALSSTRGAASHEPLATHRSLIANSHHAPRFEYNAFQLH